MLYSENGQEIVGDRIFHKCPDLVYVDTTIVAQAPVRLLVSGMGDAWRLVRDGELRGQRA